MTAAASAQTQPPDVELQLSLGGLGLRGCGGGHASCWKPNLNLISHRPARSVRPMRDDDGGLRNTLYRTTTRSGRRITAARRWLYRLAVPLGLAIIRAWWLTCRVTRVEGVAHLDEALGRAPSLVPCYWHQHQLYCGKFLVEQRSRGLTVGWLISPSVDGELGAMMVQRFGGAGIRGSSTHTDRKSTRLNSSHL